MFQKIRRKIQNKHFLSNILFSENRALCEIKWENTAETGSPQIIIPRIHIACWMPKTTNTYSQNM